MYADSSSLRAGKIQTKEEKHSANSVAVHAKVVVYALLKKSIRSWRS